MIAEVVVMGCGLFIIILPWESEVVIKGPQRTRILIRCREFIIRDGAIDLLGGGLKVTVLVVGITGDERVGTVEGGSRYQRYGCAVG